MKSLLEVLKLSTEYLQNKGVQSPRRQAEELLVDILHIPRMQIYLDFERPLTEEELDRYRQAVLRRAKGEPAQYIRGFVEFLGCEIKVSPDVLIPRQETEILASKIVEQLSKEKLGDKKLWDLCCGSGCLGIALKKRFPELEVFLSDLSPKALAIAKENAKKNEVQVHFLGGDLLTPFQGQKADFLVCNPPYISEGEFESLDVEVRQFEPKSALISGPTGLEFYERLSRELPLYLNRSARVWFEIGTGQGQKVQALFTQSCWHHCHVEADWAGHDRFFFLEFE